MHAGKCVGGGCEVVTDAEAVEIGEVVELVEVAD